MLRYFFITTDYRLSVTSTRREKAELALRNTRHTIFPNFHETTRAPLETNKSAITGNQLDQPRQLFMNV